MADHKTQNINKTMTYYRKNTRKAQKRRRRSVYIGYRNTSSPRPGSNRACLCWDEETYHIDCCDGSLHAQGIGKTTA
tara:strand:- start:304 stop:534 length:231 start_codon:yes stop_codon:yes gene_type:complete